MRHQQRFQPSLGSLEDRLAPSTVVPAATPAAPPPSTPADVAQDGNFDGQFGDQTTPDTGGTAETPSGGQVNPEAEV